MKKVWMVLLASMACMAAPAMAGETELSQRFTTCMERADGVSIDMHACIAAEHERQDGRLNRAYKTLSAALTPARKAQLVAGQRLWIQFRDANCAFYNDPDTGTMGNLEGVMCELQMTADRSAELESF